MAIQRKLSDYTVNPNWNGQLYIPFLRTSVGVSVIDHTLQFSYHGMNYTINLNQKGTVQSDGSILVAVGRKPKFRTVRKPIGMPSHTSIYFLTYAGQSLSLAEVDAWIGWSPKKSPSIAQAYRSALA